MADLKISDIQKMQHTLAVEKGWITSRTPEHAPMSILWSIDELGEAIAIIKKKGSDSIMDNPTVRAHFTEEVADVFMYLFDMMESYGITAEEFSDAYLAKFQRNLGRDWQENTALYETVHTKRLMVTDTTLAKFPADVCRLVEVLARTDTQVTLISRTDGDTLDKLLADTDVPKNGIAAMLTGTNTTLSDLFRRALADNQTNAALALVSTMEEADAARALGLTTLSAGEESIGADKHCPDTARLIEFL